jgi:polar amino acid transport system substrate-binding protein
MVRLALINADKPMRFGAMIACSRLPAALVVSIVATAVLLIATVGAAEARDWRMVRIGIDRSNPPFSSLDSDQVPAGFDVAIAQALCDRMKVTCQFVADARDALIPDLIAHKTDAVVASLVITEELKKTVDFTDKYYTISARFVTSVTSGLTDNSADAMHGKTVGAVAGSRYAAYLTEVYAPKGVAVKLYRTEAEGRIAAILASPFGLYHWFETGSGGRCCAFLGPDVRSIRYFGEGAGIAIRREDGDLRDMFNRALADTLRDGTYEKINAMYFNFLVY